ncbi:MAG: FecCD family ABC transporter permease [Rhodococcus sp. (in: high G+C Gram-positive bacteria)]
MITISDRGLLALGVCAAIGLVAVALCLGDPTVGPAHAVQALMDASNPLHTHVAVVRLPRALLGLLGGAALGLAGALMQDVLRNRIAGPEILGVSAGAAVALTAVAVLAIPAPLAALPYLALFGAAVAGTAVITAVGPTSDPTRVVLLGAAVSALASGMVIALVSLGTEGNLPLLFRYLLGSLSERGWPHLGVVTPWLIVFIPVALILRHRVAALALGDDVAAGLGISVVPTRVMALVCAAVLTAAVASVCGPVAYVALLAPHLARWILRTASSRRVFVLTPILGALLLASADLVSRIALYPIEIPVGITTTLIGVPALLLALRRQDHAR